MKENLFEMLLNLFEKSLAQLKKKENAAADSAELVEDETLDIQRDILCMKTANALSTRVITQEERIKLTKASYQFLARMKQWGVIDEDTFELVLHQLQFSDSRIVTLQEAKWTVRNVLADSLNAEQLAFLDLVLYPKDEQLTLH